jgi:hypothetical protein
VTQYIPSGVSKGRLRSVARAQPVKTEQKWVELSDEARERWGVLGWSEASWSGREPAPATEKMQWHELTAANRDAALELGYTQSSWQNYLHNNYGDRREQTILLMEAPSTETAIAYTPLLMEGVPEPSLPPPKGPQGRRKRKDSYSR